MLPLVLALLTAGTAAAQPATGDRPRGRHRVELEATLAGWRMLEPGRFEPPFMVVADRWVDRWGFGASAYARARLTDPPGDTSAVDAIADLEVALRFFVASAPRIGNLYVGASGGARTREWALRAGGGIAVPTASIAENDVLDELTMDAALYAHGAWDAWLVTPDACPIVIRGDLSYDDGTFFAGIELAGSVMPFVPARLAEGPTSLAGQTAVWGGGRIEELLALGVRTQLVGLLQIAGAPAPLDARHDEGFVSLVPFARLELPTWSVEARGTINLDDPIGVASDGSRRWSVRVAFAWSIDVPEPEPEHALD